MAKVYIYPVRGAPMPLPVAFTDGVSIDLDLSASEAHTAALPTGLYEVCVDGANARVAVGAGVTADQTSRWWRDGKDDLVYVSQFQRISVIAAT
ncbi:MAG: hypothetical protein DI537_34655 [Stutzerimonas stutzeri]|nr:MAG: hypothetical protein DI537_34655 [Stutzerimonas stutzeri]